MKRHPPAMRLPGKLVERRRGAHKGDFGHIFIIAGSARYSGAAVLCAGAAMRSGAGLVTIGIPAGLKSAIIRVKPKEVMTLPLPETKEATLSSLGFTKIMDFIKKCDVVVVGPGLSGQKSTQALARRLIRRTPKPLVIDADALNALAGHLSLLRTGGNKSLPPRVLTPHAGEMARLLGIRPAEVQAKRKSVAKEFARQHKVTLVLKGDRTVVADAGGKLYVNNTGNPGMSTAGSGDVLAGMIAAFLGQGLGAFEASKYAVYLHGFAGDLAAEEKTQMGMVASDIISKIPEAIKKCSK